MISIDILDILTPRLRFSFAHQANGIVFVAACYSHPGWVVATGYAPGFVQTSFSTGG